MIGQALFRDRTDAGRQLAANLIGHKHLDPIVVALPRGGVVVGHEVAQALDAPLDIIIVRKLGAPLQPELAIGAAVGADEPQIILDHELVRRLGVGTDYLEHESAAQTAEIRRREHAYRGDTPRIPLEGRTVILVDDGVATGSSVRAALQAIRHDRPARLILAVPVAPPEALRWLSQDAEEVVCPAAPEHFRAVGMFYDDFAQTTDEEVIRLLRLARRSG